MSRRSRSQAFTLVELLVVIGIIALLISALLPALNKARQAANLIDCQARLRTMGQALQIYTVNNRGYVPWSVVVNDKSAAPWVDGSIPNSSNKELYWWWHFTLSEVLNKNILGSDGFVARDSSIFRDRDTIEGNDARYVNHYTANPRILYQSNAAEFAPSIYAGASLISPQDRHVTRKISTIKPSTAFVIWDAPQCADYGNNAYEIAIEMDGNEFTFGHCFCFGSTNPAVVYARPVTPGGLGQSQNASVCKALQIKFNKDLRSAFGPPDGWQSQVRFRHLNNSTAAALCLDGHVETRRVGEFTVKDICTNYY
jgi:prepilin-type N-terminal cleavage/methylation domain-containing protein